MQSINTRADEMFEIIKKHLPDPFYDGDDLSVIDLGCGHADLLRRFYQLDTVGLVVGVDHDSHILRANSKKFIRLIVNGNHRFIHQKIEKYVAAPRLPAGFFDVGLCCSVLPYLSPEGRESVLDWLSEAANTTFIECQYAGDGPGDNMGIESDEDMRAWLSSYWASAEAIGRTLVLGRQKYRTIWKCEH